MNSGFGEQTKEYSESNPVAVGGGKPTLITFRKFDIIGNLDE